MIYLQKIENYNDVFDLIFLLIGLEFLMALKMLELF